MTLSRARALGKGRKRALPTDEEIGFTVPMPEASLLTVAGIFGPNASGKSNVVKALGYLIAKLNSRLAGEPCVPFLLDKSAAKAPTRFTARFFDPHTQRIFTYRLGLQAQGVVEEELWTGEDELLFRRPTGEGSWDLTTDLELMRPILSSLAGGTVALEFLLKNFKIPILKTMKYLVNGSWSADGFGGEFPHRYTCRTFLESPEDQTAIVRR